MGNTAEKVLVDRCHSLGRPLLGVPAGRFACLLVFARVVPQTDDCFHPRRHFLFARYSASSRCLLIGNVEAESHLTQCFWQGTAIAA